jgi:hypothetical protein
VELGAALALQFACKIPPTDRKIGKAPVEPRILSNSLLASTSGAMPWIPDRSKVFASQLSAKERFAGEAGGIRLTGTEGH